MTHIHDESFASESSVLEIRSIPLLNEMQREMLVAILETGSAAHWRAVARLTSQSGWGMALVALQGELGCLSLQDNGEVASSFRYPLSQIIVLTLRWGVMIESDAVDMV